MSNQHYLYSDGQGLWYLCAIIDWYSRKIPSHRVSISLEVDPCIETLEEAISKHGMLEIFNHDQGSPKLSN